MEDKRRYDLMCDRPDEAMPYIREFEKRLQDEGIDYDFEWDIDRSAIFYLDIDDDSTVMITISGENAVHLIYGGIEDKWFIPSRVRESLFEKILSYNECKCAHFSVGEDEDKLFGEEGYMVWAEYYLPSMYEIPADIYAKLLYLAWLEFSDEVITFEENFSVWLKDVGITERPKILEENLINAISQR